MAKDSEPLAEGSFTMRVILAMEVAAIIERDRLLAGAARRRGAE